MEMREIGSRGGQLGGSQSTGSKSHSPTPGLWTEDLGTRSSQNQQTGLSRAIEEE